MHVAILCIGIVVQLTQALRSSVTCSLIVFSFAGHGLPQEDIDAAFAMSAKYDF